VRIEEARTRRRLTRERGAQIANHDDFVLTVSAQDWLPVKSLIIERWRSRVTRLETSALQSQVEALLHQVCPFPLPAPPPRPAFPCASIRCTSVSAGQARCPHPACAVQRSPCCPARCRAGDWRLQPRQQSERGESLHLPLRIPPRCT